MDARKALSQYGAQFEEAGRQRGMFTARTLPVIGPPDNEATRRPS
jgi:hypothetical protein